MRAERFAQSWRELSDVRVGGDSARADKATTQMGAMAQGLRRDPELAEALKRHLPEMEIEMERERERTRDLGRSR